MTCRFLLLLASSIALCGQVLTVKDGLVHDYGEVGNKSKLKGQFVLENISDEDVEIRILPSQCACFIVTCECENVPAHRSTVINYSYSVDVSKGFFDKSITIIAQGSKKPILLHIRGRSTRLK